MSAILLYHFMTLKSRGPLDSNTGSTDEKFVFIRGVVRLSYAIWADSLTQQPKYTAELLGQSKFRPLTF
jgi:hypothetical protein